MEICPAAVLRWLQCAKEVVLLDGTESKTTVEGCNATQYMPEVAVFHRGCRSVLSPCIILKSDTRVFLLQESSIRVRDGHRLHRRSCQCDVRAVSLRSNAVTRTLLAVGLERDSHRKKSSIFRFVAAFQAFIR